VSSRATIGSSTARTRGFTNYDEDDIIKSPKSPKLEDLFQPLEKPKESELKADKKATKEKKDGKEKIDKDKKDKDKDKKDLKKSLHTSSATGTLRSRDSGDGRKGRDVKFGTLSKSSANSRKPKKFTVELPDVPDSDSEGETPKSSGRHQKSRVNLLKTDSFTKASVSPRNTHLVLPSSGYRDFGKPRKIASYNTLLNNPDDSVHK